jgi:quercetin dioxygenase-like cupin family protein
VIIKKNMDVREDIPEEEGTKDVLRRILIGPDDGSLNIIMRHFKILPGGNTPLHRHNWEHVVKIEKGKGIVVNEAGEEIVISEGESLFIPENEEHQFKNPFSDPFEFLCIIPNPERR